MWSFGHSKWPSLDSPDFFETMLKAVENSVTLRLAPPAGIADAGAVAAITPDVQEKSTRKRNVQHVATHEDKLRVMTWMLAEEHALLEDSGSGEPDTMGKKAEKVGKGERMCLATRAIAQFPDLFRGSAQANYMKASRWWKDSKEYIYETSGMSATKKARSGRGRKTNAWTSWLQGELKDAIDLDGHVSWNNKDLLALAKTILDNSTHPEFNKDYVVPQRNCALGDLVNLRWIQVFKEKFHVNAHNHAPRPAAELGDMKEAELLHHLATIRDTKGGAPLGKKEVLMVATQLLRETQPALKMDASWYKNFCDRHPDLNLTPAVASPPMPTTPSKSTAATASLLGRGGDMPRGLSAKPDNATLIIDETKASELFLAIGQGQFNTVKTLLIRGVSTEGCDENGCTALVVATKLGQFNLVKVLLEFGAKTEATDERGLTSLVLATATSQFHVVKNLLECHANVEATNEQCKTPLMLAAERGDLKIVKLLLRMGANVEARDEDDNTAILVAAKQHHVAVVDFLIKKGATVDVHDIEGVSLSALHRSKPDRGVENVLI
ncbi:Aste57867_14 [Aphanomyces stellatus]|uniref:Aste57867_14 protein n=1 Tax=Aphanomyces stellatus TaxID=120398 RepID=A0A485K459_9STRA|nr:hypothetical protein As57867_000014 [Aphanomyces stellatus]VFT77240.1 Aste57867_14 [Aphanomyces stellatus]